MSEIAELEGTLESHGQQHLLRHLERLDPTRRARLADALAAIDWCTVEELRALLARPAEESAPPRFEPPELFPLERGPAEEERARQASARGEALLAEGRVAYLVVAGGQASRLGCEGPKGCFPAGPLSGRSLFEWHVRRLRGAARRWGGEPVWYVMTSPANHAESEAFFRNHNWFGLGPERVRLFSQAMLPALDEQGRVLLADLDRPFLAPNGHGGVLAAFRDAHLIEHARALGVATISYFQVDNPLVRPADPLFLGLHALECAEMSSKVVEKRDADEKVGVIGRIDGRLGCIEYSDLPARLRGARDGAGRLLFRAGNIAAHAIELEFLERITSGELRLPWHVAHKQMRVLDQDGRPVEREGFKFETFVFDALGLAERSVTLEVDRALEFSPIKNASGEDSPETARRDLFRLHAAWAREAGLQPPPAGPEGVPPVEVDPLVAQDAAELATALAEGRARAREQGGGLLVEMVE